MITSKWNLLKCRNTCKGFRVLLNEYINTDFSVSTEPEDNTIALTNLFA